MTDRYPNLPHDDRVRRIGPPNQTPPWYVALLGGMVLVLLIIAVALLIRDTDGETETAGTTTQVTSPTLPSTTTSTTVSSTASTSSTTQGSTTSSSTTLLTTTASTTTTTTALTTTTASTTTTTPSTTVVDPAVYASAVWPWFESPVRYDDPVDAARDFAEDFVGFDTPILGAFQQGDSRSGEIEVRPADDGPVTTVLLRQLGPDSSWWVLGAVSENILVTEPDALSGIDSPLVVTGEALAVDGVVTVELRADGEEDPLLEGSVLGGGAERRPFEGSFTWDDPGEGYGALVLFVESMDDGTVWEATVIRVAFATD